MRLTTFEADRLADERARWRWERNRNGNYVRRPNGLSQTIYRRKDGHYGLAHGGATGCKHHGPYATAKDAMKAADEFGAEQYRKNVGEITGRL